MINLFIIHDLESFKIFIQVTFDSHVVGKVSYFIFSSRDAKTFYPLSFSTPVCHTWCFIGDRQMGSKIPYLFPL